jgi:uncharacterized protein (DUF1800 family)
MGTRTWLTRLVLSVMVLALAGLPARAQSQRELELLKKLGGKANTSPKDEQKDDQHKKLSPQEALRVRLLEIESGARTLSDLGPQERAIVGPPLNEREACFNAVNRMAFGPRPGMVQKMLDAGGWESWASQQIEPDSIDDSEHEAEVLRRFPWVKWSMDQMADAVAKRNRKGTLSDNPTYAGNKWMYEQLPAMVIYRAANSKRQFKEVMCEFWRNHFAVDQTLMSKRMPFTVANYDENVIRKYAFGKFGDMLKASATHPAMLEFLDNWISRAGAWNENYAREVMELHTLGADRYYNEHDVTELSKVLTGWTFNNKYEFTFNQGNHEPGTKVVLGRPIPQGFAGGKMAIEMLASHRGTSMFISEKLCRYLINDVPPQALVQKVADVFRKTDGDLKKVYWAVITSPEFMSRISYRSKFRTPFEAVIATLRATNAQIDDADAVADAVAGMGERIYACPDPTGYYDTAESWLDTGVLTRRWDFIFKLVGGDISGVKIDQKWLAQYKDLEPEAMKKKFVDDLIGAEVGGQTDELLTKIAKEGIRMWWGDTVSAAPVVLSVVLGSPAFQQQ